MMTSSEDNVRCANCGATWGYHYGTDCPDSKGQFRPFPAMERLSGPTPVSPFPDSPEGRKEHPVFTGVLMYFPDAIAAVARVSKLGNDQHNPGEKLHWAREKSTDQTNTATRHMMDHGVGNTKDTDGTYHLAKAAWRILAELQLTIEKERQQK